jgi:predicted nucleotide-binding protein
MKKIKLYSNRRYPISTLNKISTYLKGGDETRNKFQFNTLQCEIGDEVWEYDDVSEFIAQYRKSVDAGYFWLSSEIAKVYYTFYPSYCRVTVESKARANIQEAFNIFEEDIEIALIPESAQSNLPTLSIFVGHGRSSDWRELKEHLQDKHQYIIQAYETGARAGHSIRDILDELMEANGFAILVLTAEDEQSSGDIRARQNVIHEIGLFQGRLGFSKAIMLVQKGVEVPSNLAGIQFIPFEQGRIRETFGDVLATIKREFHA